MNFLFDYNSIDVIHLISCTVCGSQYTGQYTDTTVTKFREKFNHYRSSRSEMFCEKGVFL